MFSRDAGDVLRMCQDVLRRAFRFRRKLQVLQRTLRGPFYTVTRSRTLWLNAGIERIDDMTRMQLDRIKVVGRFLHVTCMDRRDLRIRDGDRKEPLCARRVLPHRHHVTDMRVHGVRRWPRGLLTGSPLRGERPSGRYAPPGPLIQM